MTRGPGMVGALLVGLVTAKALAAATRKPLVGVDHLQGHVAANFLEPDPLEPPFLCLIASGGHTLLAGVRDRGGVRGPRAAPSTTPPGEALDKGARLLGLPLSRAARRSSALAARRGPGGVRASRSAMTRDPGLDFSFSGLKTALLYAVRDLDPDELERRRADLAAELPGGGGRPAARRSSSRALDRRRLGRRRAGRRRRRERPLAGRARRRSARSAACG